MAADSKKAVDTAMLERFLAKCGQVFAAKTNATTAEAGLMSASDKAKLDGVDLSGGTSGQVLTRGASGYGWAEPSGASYTAMTAADLAAGTSTTAMVASPKVVADYVSGEIDAALGVVANGSY